VHVELARALTPVLQDLMTWWCCPEDGTAVAVVGVLR